MNTVISAIMPPTDDYEVRLILEHRTLGRVEYVHGAMLNQQAADKLIEMRGAPWGTIGSIPYWECFPHVDVCRRCVGEVSRTVNGRQEYYASGPTYHMSSTPCINCVARECANIARHHLPSVTGRKMPLCGRVYVDDGECGFLDNLIQRANDCEDILASLSLCTEIARHDCEYQWIRRDIEKAVAMLRGEVKG